MNPLFETIDSVTAGLRSTGYITDRDVATTLHLAAHLHKPILAEGPAGVGKTELAKAVATCLGTELVRLQCYEGLDEAKTLYEWKYAKQLLYTQLLRDQIGDIVGDAPNLTEAIDRIAKHEDAFFSARFLQARPLLQAIQADHQTVLLIDEVDRAEDELEAFFLEVLAEFQVTVPELGTIKATHHPIVILTSNNTRELSDALRRRCLHLWMDYPSVERESEIVRTRVPGISDVLAEQVAVFVDKLRTLDLKKNPSISESIDWARSLIVLSADKLGEEIVKDTLNVLLKYEGDIETASAKVTTMLEEAG